MRGRDIALATLMQQDVPEPCINYCWMTHSKYLSHCGGRDYWSDPENVFFDYLHYSGINLCPQWYMPSDGHRKLEQGEMIHEPKPGGWDNIGDPKEIFEFIDTLPDEKTVEAEFNIEQVADDYAAGHNAHMERANHETLFIGHYGQADFMGGYNRWGYENYLIAMMDDPEAMSRFWRHSALCGRLYNQAIVRAVEKHTIAPFVYSGQDICTATGPITSPQYLRDHYFPHLKWCLEPLVENGIGIIWHCDGDIRQITPELLDLGIAGMQGFEEEHGVNYGEICNLKTVAGKPLILLGCVSVVSTFPHGTVDDVKAAVERSFTLAGKGRGFVLSSTSSVMPEVPLENIEAFFRHGRKFGREFLA